MVAGHDAAATTPGDSRVADRAYADIRHQILSGQRAAGEWLREDDLASSLGVSRTPVREALRRLTAEGLVTHEHNRGVRVQSWSTPDLEEIYGLRSVLEPWGSALAATRGLVDTDELETLAARMDEAARSQTPNLDEITRVNNLFHRRVLEGSGNSRLVTLVASVVEVPLVSRTFSLYSRDALRRSLAHHHEIVSALRAGDPAWAESVMRSHVRSAWAALSGVDPST